MAQDETRRLFSERVREQLLLQRVLVLDGILDDDNGTLLTTQLLTLAAEDGAAGIALWINSPGGSVPATIREGAGLRQREWIARAVKEYVETASQHRAGTRRIHL